LKDESRLRVFENRLLWRIFGPKREAVRRRSVICDVYQMSFGKYHQGETAAVL
jgi:hypothetical protein